MIEEVVICKFVGRVPNIALARV